MSTAREAAIVLERLLVDPAFRAVFRAAPAATLEQHGLPDVAQRLSGDARALQTLELRESRSSLAGVLMAAAVEGVALFDAVGRQARPLDPEAAAAMRHALARPAVQQLTSALAAARPTAATGASEAAASHAIAGHNAASSMPAAPASAVSGPPATPASTATPSTPVVANAPALPNAAGSMPAASAPGPGAVRTGIGAAARLGQPPERLAAEAESVSADGNLEYPGDDAPKEQLAAWMGAAAKKAGLPPELPIMAALQESGLRNLPGGDADSAGFFQMRERYWNTGQYRGYRDDPELQLRWFIDHALNEQAAHPEFTRSPASYGEWIANVERPAAEHRGKYQPHLTEAQRLLARADDQPQLEASADVDAPTSIPEQMLKIAAKELGTREDPPGSNDSPRIAQYRTAGPPAGVGPWCAYFVSWVSRRAGVPLGDQGFASVDALWAWAEQTGRAAQSPKPGDLIVWDEHVGIVERIDADGTIHTIEGNSSDEVARRTHSPAGVIGYVRLTKGG